MDNSKELLDKWINVFDNYLACEIECNKKLAIINNIIINLNKLLGNQKSDDLTFYISIINNSYFYLTNSMKILKIKFMKDLNNIWNIINPESFLFSQDVIKSNNNELSNFSIASLKKQSVSNEPLQTKFVKLNTPSFDEPKFEVLNKLNFERMVKDYKKKIDNIMIDKNNNNNNIRWVKNDKYENLSHFDNELNEALEYHMKLINQLKKLIDIESAFYNSDN
jgi:hypothetical protein